MPRRQRQDAAEEEQDVHHALPIAPAQGQVQSVQVREGVASAARDGGQLDGGRPAAVPWRWCEPRLGPCWQACPCRLASGRLCWQACQHRLASGCPCWQACRCGLASRVGAVAWPGLGALQCATGRPPVHEPDAITGHLFNKHRRTQHTSIGVYGGVDRQEACRRGSGSMRPCDTATPQRASQRPAI